MIRCNHQRGNTMINVTIRGLWTEAPADAEPDIMLDGTRVSCSMIAPRTNVIDDGDGGRWVGLSEPGDIEITTPAEDVPRSVFNGASLTVGAPDGSKVTVHVRSIETVARPGLMADEDELNLVPPKTYRLRLRTVTADELAAAAVVLDDMRGTGATSVDRARAVIQALGLEVE